MFEKYILNWVDQQEELSEETRSECLMLLRLVILAPRGQTALKHRQTRRRQTKAKADALIQGH